MIDNNYNPGISRKKPGLKSITNSALTQQLGKLPPQAVDIEEAVLGALMLEKDALSAVIDVLRPECFYKDSHQKIFAAIHQLFHKAEPNDILTVTHTLKKS